MQSLSGNGCRMCTWGRNDLAIKVQELCGEGNVRP